MILDARNGGVTRENRHMTWRKPGDKALVRAILQVFQGDAERSYAQLSTVPKSAWQKTDFWLNASGLAFYFLDQVCRLGIAEAVPPETLRRLRTPEGSPNTACPTRRRNHLQKLESLCAIK